MKNRRSIRLKEYDYSQSGAYFVTICAHDRECLFGEIVDGKMILNDAGQIVQIVWDEIPKHIDHVEVDTHGQSPWHSTSQASLDLNPGVLATSHI